MSDVSGDVEVSEGDGEFLEQSFHAVSIRQLKRLLCSFDCVDSVERVKANTNLS